MREGGRRGSLGEGATGVREIENIQEETEAGAGGMVREKVGEEEEEVTEMEVITITPRMVTITIRVTITGVK